MRKAKKKEKCDNLKKWKNVVRNKKINKFDQKLIEELNRSEKKERETE